MVVAFYGDFSLPEGTNYLFIWHPYFDLCKVNKIIESWEEMYGIKCTKIDSNVDLSKILEFNEQVLPNKISLDYKANLCDLKSKLRTLSL